MKYAIVGKVTRAVHSVEEAELDLDGEPEPPRAKSYAEVLEISEADASRIAATADDRTAIWFIQPDGTLEDLAERRAREIADRPPVVPKSVTRRGLRKALLDDGVTFADIRTELEKIPDASEREDALIDLEDAQTIRRDHPLVAGIGALLSKTDEQLDNYFILAKTLDT